MHPPAFFKYTTAEVAQKILSTQKLRWSSPALFNDPFDCYFSLAPKFNIDDVRGQQKRCLIDLLTQKQEPEFSPTNPYVSDIRLLREICKGRSSHEVEVDLGDVFEGFLSDFDLRCQITNDLWKRECRDLRLLCVCEENDNLLLWSHYADCHTGAVLQFECIKELDVPLLAAAPVIYSQDVPSMATEEEWLKITLGLMDLPDGLSVWKRLVLTKAKGWEYENEWRVVTKRRDGERDGYEDTPFYPREIS